MKLQSLCPFLVAWFTAVNHYTLFTISQPIFNQQEAANCSYKSQSELLLQARFPQMPSQAQLLYNPAEAGGFILKMKLNKWSKFQMLRQIPAIQHCWAWDGLLPLGSMHTCASSCLCCLWLASGAAAAACCTKFSICSSFGHSPSNREAAEGTAGAAAPHPRRAHERLCCWWRGRGGQHVLPRMPRVPTVFPTLPKKANPQTRHLPVVVSDLIKLVWALAAHVSPYCPHCLSQCLTCNGE